LHLPNLLGSPLSLQGWRGQPKQSREGYEIARPDKSGRAMTKRIAGRGFISHQKVRHIKCLELNEKLKLPSLRLD